MYLALAVGRYTAVCCPDEGKHITDEGEHITDEGKHIYILGYFTSFVDN